MHDCPGWSQWLAGILIFTVAILWSRPPAEEEALVFRGDNIFQPEWDCGIEVGLRYRSGSKWPYSKYEDLEEEICSGPQVERLVSPR